MSGTPWQAWGTLTVLAMGLSAQAQVSDIPIPPRLGLPFATEMDRLPGPPRAMGELPAGESQPPSTYPGFLSGPPRAMGFAPQRSPLQPPFGVPPIYGGLPSTTGTLPPITSPGSNVTLPSGSFFIPGLSRFGEPPEGAPRGGLGPEDLAAPEERPTGPKLPPLTLGDVLASAERTYPPFLAVFQDRDIARGDVVSALGSFDINLNADARNYPLGYYDRYLHDVFVEVPLRNLGGKVFSGYRLAWGDWPPYYIYLSTRGGGAFVNGLELPLLKNRAIDPKRAKLYQSEIEQRKVEPTILKQRITLFKDAAKAYWNWVASGQQYLVYRDLVEVARLRERALEEQVRERVVKAADLIDFRRVVLSREQQVIVARRRFQQAAIELSLYNRDPRGFPCLPDDRSLPRQFPTAVPPDPARLKDDMEVALRLRPEVFALRLQAGKAQVDLELAENQMLPSLNFYLFTEQNVGDRLSYLRKDFRPFIMEASLLFDVPLQRRFARGRIQAASATIRQINMQAQFAADRIQADVLDATSGIQNAYDQLVRYRVNVELNRQLQELETEAVREGIGNLFTFNLREQATSDALVVEIESEYKYFAALADYRGALGLDAVIDPSGEPPTAVPSDVWAVRSGVPAPASTTAGAGAPSAPPPEGGSPLAPRGEWEDEPDAAQPEPANPPTGPPANPPAPADAEASRSGFRLPFSRFWPRR